MIYVTLGDVTFQDFEVPERIRFGGEQRTAVHELIGGGRVVDVLGGQPAEIGFHGIFSGTDAAARAQSLDSARAAGAVLALGWDGFFYHVVIADFEAAYEKPFWIPFRITCLAVSDSAIAAAAIVIPVGSLISSDLAVVAQWAGAAGLCTQNFNAANAVAAQAGCDMAVNVAGANLIRNMDIVNNPTTPDAAVTALAGVSQNSGRLAAACYAGGYLARAVQNIGLGDLA